MKLTRIIVLFAAVFFLTSVAEGLAANCPNGFIHVGDSVTKVRKRCGKPQYKTTSKIGLSSSQEIWHYDFGDRRIPFSVTIRDGKVIRIKND